VVVTAATARAGMAAGQRRSMPRARPIGPDIGRPAVAGVVASGTAVDRVPA
jgi:hypothetical protein